MDAFIRSGYPHAAEARARLAFTPGGPRPAGIHPGTTSNAQLASSPGPICRHIENTSIFVRLLSKIRTKNLK
jgi:hypothetical protein